MSNLPRRWLHRFIPSHFHDPVGLTRRLLRTGDPAALFAMQTAVLGLLAAPLDLVLQIAEQRRYRKAPAPRLPLLFICGAPRTGTTLVQQVLINHLPFAFINNLTAVFPRAPLTANRIFRSAAHAGGTAYHSYYGRTVGFSGPNDGLHLWDRWLGTDRTQVRTALTPVEQSEMRRFFGAMEQVFGRPVLAKNNNLNACASLVAEVFDRAFFICMTRDPLFLAQAQLRARLEIHGVEDIAYGLADTYGSGPGPADVVEDVCRQVLYHQHVAQAQQSRIGAERFWIVEYEAFCQNPSALVDAVAVKVLGQPQPTPATRLPPFTASNRVRIDPERFRHIAETLARLGHPATETRPATVSSVLPE
jgi:hypothetical protein